MPEPLYGVLQLCPVAVDATGPGSRSYLVEVPQEYIDATTDGRISVVFEPTRTVRFAKLHPYTWILWLSRSPFREVPLRATAVPARSDDASVAHERKRAKARTTRRIGASVAISGAVVALAGVAVLGAGGPLLLGVEFAALGGAATLTGGIVYVISPDPGPYSPTKHSSLRGSGLGLTWRW